MCRDMVKPRVPTSLSAHWHLCLCRPPGLGHLRLDWVYLSTPATYWHMHTPAVTFRVWLHQDTLTDALSPHRCTHTVTEQLRCEAGRYTAPLAYTLHPSFWDWKVPSPVQSVPQLTERTGVLRPIAHKAAMKIS